MHTVRPKVDNVDAVQEASTHDLEFLNQPKCLLRKAFNQVVKNGIPQGKAPLDAAGVELG